MKMLNSINKKILMIYINIKNNQKKNQYIFQIFNKMLNRLKILDWTSKILIKTPLNIKKFLVFYKK